MVTHFYKLIEWAVRLSISVFTKEEDKNTFNRIEPIRDRELFTEKLVSVLESFGHNPESAQRHSHTSARYSRL